jgi:hypothetical protein
MTTELEALVASLYIVGGRAIRTAPPGALVQKAPRHCPRTRAQDTVFALLTLSGEGHAPASLHEGLVRVAAEGYFQSTATVTASLREALSAVNAELMARNRQASTSHKAHLVCAVLRGGEAYVAQAGACQSFFQQSGEVSRFPADLDELQGNPLGLGTRPEIRLTHYTVAPGDVLALSDRALADLERPKVDAALNSGDADGVVSALTPLAGASASVLVVKFALPEQVTEAAPPKEPPPVERAAAAYQKLAVRIRETGLGQRLRDVGREADVGQALGSLGRALALGLARFTEVANWLLDLFLPEPDEEEGGPRIPTTLAAGVTVLIAVGVTVVVVGLMLRNSGRDRCEDFVRLSAEEAAQAKLLTGHPDEAREAWVAVRLHLEQALEICPPSDERPARALDEARGFIDEYDQVVRPRPAVTELRHFPAGTVPTGPVLHAPDIYTLDVVNVALYRDQLMENGYQLVEENTQPVLRKGDTVDGYVIEHLVDIEWMAEGTVRNRNVLVALEPTSGVLIAYSPTLPPAATPLVGWEEWMEPVAISSWGGNFYILDPGADQIWRYRVSPSSGDYSDSPERYFDNLATNPDLEGAIDFSIDDQGNVYILFEGARVMKFWGGESQPFSLDSMPMPLLEVRSIFLDSGPFAQALYLVDAGNESIFETTLRGNFAYHFKAANEEAFRDLRGVFVKSGTDNVDNVYVVANSGLYHFSKSTTQ